MVILKHVFSSFWHNMVNHNTKNSIKKRKSFSQFILCDSNIYLLQTNVHHYVFQKCEYILKLIEMVFSIYEICNIY
jgi:hypothetical protein